MVRSRDASQSRQQAVPLSETCFRRV